MRHGLKTWPAYFERLVTGEKTFEVRRDDRGFQVEDELELCEWDPKRADETIVVGFQPGFTGRVLLARVSYVLGGGQFGVEPGFAVLALADVRQVLP